MTYKFKGFKQVLYKINHTNFVYINIPRSKFIRKNVARRIINEILLSTGITNEDILPINYKVISYTLLVFQYSVRHSVNACQSCCSFLSNCMIFLPHSKTCINCFHSYSFDVRKMFSKTHKKAHYSRTARDVYVN